MQVRTIQVNLLNVSEIVTKLKKYFPNLKLVNNRKIRIPRFTCSGGSMKFEQYSDGIVTFNFTIQSDFILSGNINNNQCQKSILKELHVNMQFSNGFIRPFSGITFEEILLTIGGAYCGNEVNKAAKEIFNKYADQLTHLKGKSIY
jgi:hypothetical protein